VNTFSAAACAEMTDRVFAEPPIPQPWAGRIWGDQRALEATLRIHREVRQSLFARRINFNSSLAVSASASGEKS
jgi:hypothetical protein